MNLSFNTLASLMSLYRNNTKLSTENLHNDNQYVMLNVQDMYSDKKASYEKNKMVIRDNYIKALETLESLKLEVFLMENTLDDRVKSRHLDNLLIKANEIKDLHNEISINVERSIDIHSYKFRNYCNANVTFWENTSKNIDDKVEIIDNLDNVNAIINTFDIDQGFEKLLSSLNMFYRSIKLDFQYSTENKTYYAEEMKKVFNDSDNVWNSLKISDFEDVIGIDKRLDVLSSINDEFKKIYFKMKEQTNHNYCLAEEFMKAMSSDNTSSSQDFLIKKVIDNKIIQSRETLNSSKYKTLITFRDRSILFEDNEGKLIKPFNNTESNKIVYSILEDDLKYILRKHPTISKEFTSKLKNNEYAILSAIVCSKTYIENESILKSNKYNFNEAIKNIKDWNEFEELDDNMHSFINRYKIKSYAHSIASNKYKHLYNDDSYIIIKELYDLQIDVKELQLYVGTKLAAFKTPEDFNYSLSRLLNSYNDFNYEALIEKANLVNANVCVGNDDLVIIKIENFEQSKKLGSPSWCISRDNYYFNSYTKDDNKQYFIYDLTNLSSEHESIIGVTLTKDGELHASHRKDDSPINVSDPLIKNIIELIRQSDSEFYTPMPKKNNFTI